ncbi:hypothetical protein [Rugosimonospora africana]|uniref:hypothetical protein n=1 Tax=Rugosimonospora africana TaxID=556532 RepID=UPI0019419543|nr:hypothetical protein [Rugosimonospora africana]
MSEAVWNVAEIKAPATADGIVSGAVWFTLHGVDFPATGWTDLPLSVLGSAVTAYGAIHGGELEAFSYIFDGPYFMYYRRIDASEPTVYIEANCDRDEDRVVCLSTGEIPLEELRSTLLRAVETLHAEIVAKPYAGDSIQIAAKLIATLSGTGAASRRNAQEA